MSLAPQTRLGAYEILSPLGAGGMGEVYRARDTRLDREVALKILPSEDPERLRRFEQEARAASALNHPNILTVYEFGNDGGVPYIATELVDGELLAPRNDRGIRALLDLAVQMADGLAAAHAAGIVHRDLKPGNIMVTREGRIKILDFGLAKTVARAAAAGDDTQLLTVTDPGTILGTIAYMSPEQAKGARELDGRSDQFSFGLILYELASGKRAFTRDTGAETMSAIIRDEPEPMPPSIPAPLRWTIERCLAKDPQHRYGDTRDLYLELRHLRDHISEAVTSGGARPVEAPPPRRRWIWVAGPVAAFALFAGGYFLHWRVAGVANPPRFQRLTFRQGLATGGRFTADGRSIVFNAIWEGTDSHGYMMSLDSLDTRALNLPDKADVAAVSSKGELAILMGPPSDVGRVLARRPLSGGAPREIIEHVLVAGWSPDGESLAVVRAEGGQRRVEYPIGKVIHESAGSNIFGLTVSPDGESVAFQEYVKGQPVLRVVSRAGAVKLAAPLNNLGIPSWSPDGREIWASVATDNETTLVAVNLSGKQRTLARLPGLANVSSVSRDGRALITAFQVRTGVLCLPPGATAERELSWLGSAIAAAISADGKLLLTTENGLSASGTEAVYLRSTDGSPAIRLGQGYADSLSPDGKWVQALRTVPKAYAVLMPIGPGEEKPVSVAGHEDWDTSIIGWLPDGKRFVINGKDTGRKLYRQYLWDSSSGQLTPLSPAGSDQYLVSDDGAQLLYRGPDKNWYANEVTGGSARAVAGLKPTDTVLRWSDDGHGVYVADTYIDAKLEILRVNLLTGERKLWKTIVTPTGDTRIANPVITPDGKSYAYSHYRIAGDVYLVEGLK
jgi:eukaryotic-like serine/threonine-protein kinase